MSSSSLTFGPIGVGFGTAALGENCYNVVQMSLQAGFRKFDTAEADWWYDQKAVGHALRDFFAHDDDNHKDSDHKCLADECSRTCHAEGLQISTKIPPWSLTSMADIRAHASSSRDELVGFCEDEILTGEQGNFVDSRPYPLDVYFIHAPSCWDGWHPRCTNPPPTLGLRDAWMAMEAVVGVDHSSQRIGLSNVSPAELLDIIHFVQERQDAGDTTGSYPPPRMPDAVQAFADPLAPSNDLRRICRDHGIEFVSYSTLGTQHRNYPENPVLNSPIVQELAQRHGRSVAEIVLSWALQNDMSVIPRSNKEHHIGELANMLTQPYFLSDTDLQAMDTMSLI